MKLTLANIKELKRKSDSPLTKRVCNYVIDRWGDYDDKKYIFTDVLHYGGAITTTRSISSRTYCTMAVSRASWANSSTIQTRCASTSSTAKRSMRCCTKP